MVDRERGTIRRRPWAKPTVQAEAGIEGLDDDCEKRRVSGSRRGPRSGGEDMFRSRKPLLLAGIFALLIWGESSALTREIAELQRAKLTFDQSILNQLTFGTYRDPFDELQGRPYNLLFQNIGRHSNLSPWQGQEGNYTRYLNALIGNNGTANVDNDADSIQGALIHRVSPGWAWGVSGAFLAGNNDNAAASNGLIFSNADDFSGFDVRGAAARQLGETRVLGFGVRATSALSETLDDDFEIGVGGTFSKDAFKQFDMTFDVGLRTFINNRSSWEIGLEVGS
ncbi:MAG: hypothetical protein OER88_07515, partial [Planctomycetota bacterium]|nr:hypothetical protein [Planctomycetota bacterium]